MGDFNIDLRFYCAIDPQVWMSLTLASQNFNQFSFLFNTKIYLSFCSCFKELFELKRKYIERAVARKEVFQHLVFCIAVVLNQLFSCTFQETCWHPFKGIFGCWKWTRKKMKMPGRNPKDPVTVTKIVQMQQDCLKKRQNFAKRSAKYFRKSGTILSRFFRPDTLLLPFVLFSLFQKANVEEFYESTIDKL